MSNDKPLIDRGALQNAFMAKRAEAGGCSEGPECAACYRLAGEEADVALSLARPMATAEQIDGILEDYAVGECLPGEVDLPYRERLRNALLLLLTGAAS